MNFKTLCLIFLTISIPTFVKADAPEIEYVYPISTAWTEEKTAFGIPKTPFIPYIHALLLEAGYRVKTKPMPPKRMFRDFQDGQSQFGMLVKASALKDCCLFSSKPVTKMNINVYWHKDSPAIHTQDDLIGQKLGLIHGYSYGKFRNFIQNHEIKPQIRNATNHEDLFSTLILRKTGEYVVDYEPISEEIIARLTKQHGETMVQLRSTTLIEIPLYFVVSRKVPNAEQVLSDLEQASQKIDVEGYIARFKSRLIN